MIQSSRHSIKIALKYDRLDSKQPVIKNIQRVSTPGLTKICRCVTEMPRVLNGLGIAISFYF